MHHFFLPEFSHRLKRYQPIIRPHREGVYVLSPEFRLRKEKTRILAYAGDPLVGGLKEKYRYSNSAEAIFFSLFDGRRRWKECVEAFVMVFGIQEGYRRADRDLRRLVAEYTDTFGWLLVKAENLSESDRVKYDPSDFIIDHDSIAMHNSHRLDRPLTISFHLNTMCNRRCIYCYADSQTREPEPMPRARLLSLIDESHQLDVGYIELGGADPLLYPDLTSITARLVDHGYHPLVSTKQRVTVEKARSIAETGVRFIQISLDSSEPDTASMMVGVSDYLSCAYDSIAAIQSVGLDVRVKSVVTGRNINGIPKLLEALADRGVKCALLDSYGRTLFRHDDSLFYSNEQAQRVNLEIQEFKAKHPEMEVLANIGEYHEPDEDQRRAAWYSRASCSTARSAMTVLGDGKVVVCDKCPISEEFILGDVSEMSISECWQSPAMESFVYPDRESLREPCRSCMDFDACIDSGGRCWRDCYLAYDAVDSADPKCPNTSLPLRFN